MCDFVLSRLSILQTGRPHLHYPKLPLREVVKHPSYPNLEEPRLELSRLSILQTGRPHLHYPKLPLREVVKHPSYPNLEEPRLEPLITKLPVRTVMRKIYPVSLSNHSKKGIFPKDPAYPAYKLPSETRPTKPLRLRVI
ncbi:uncharacterized protein MELLADRAFT_110373 [Melampsora larici-populina 98AG31]|uniref:Uncharacterized protein n=1 Tax=Melampsora larici-populina (strain 98AG31 / pathotype 3-4-7) TaxID=747676 RepID=F4RZK7_MELLP|nr:uncharacterized protein MELLADRAFT_110373 [Melampsora larici-populina 98AG31]EGG02173.1 hypothetical protein MELLADRAFT_110373 [Melampsora larici-populina 98AG31]